MKRGLGEGGLEKEGNRYLGIFVLRSFELRHRELMSSEANQKEKKRKEKHLQTFFLFFIYRKKNRV